MQVRQCVMKIRNFGLKFSKQEGHIWETYRRLSGRIKLAFILLKQNVSVWIELTQDKARLRPCGHSNETLGPIKAEHLWTDFIPFKPND
jgi:hypothetical protein